MNYRSNPVWSDIQPIPQDDGPDPIVPIAYKPEYTEAMDYFRAIAAVEELSERALALSKDVISMNPAHYTVWQYRYRILKAMSQKRPAIWLEELEFLDEFTPDNKKNYQVWHHRQKIVMETVSGLYPDLHYDVHRELEFTEEMFLLDAKNYHAWTYRQWVIRMFGFWQQDLDYVTHLIDQDVRNNSAWNERFFIFKKGNLPGCQMETELSFALEKIELAPDNESAWNYIRGLIDQKSFSDYPQVEECCRRFAQNQNPIQNFLHASSLLVDILITKNRKQDLEEAKQLCSILADQVDVIRKKFWMYRQSSIDLLQ